MIIRFGGCELDLDRLELRRDGDEIAVEPQVFDVLAYLLQHRDRVVPKHELLDNIWGDRFVSESALTSRIKSARRAVGDTGRDQRVIKTVHGRGYRFVADVADDTRGGDDIERRAQDRRTTTGDAPSQLAAVLTALVDGRGRALEVESPTRTQGDIVSTVAELALATDLLVGRGACDATSGHPMLCVVDAVDELAQRRPSLLDALPGACRTELDRVLDGGMPASRQRLFVAVREMLVRASAESPVVVLLSGLELADRDAMALVDELGRLARHHAILVVAVHASGRRLGRPFEVLDLSRDPLIDRDDDLEIPPELRPHLTRVALTGPRFDLADLRAAADLDEREARAAIDRALDARLIEPISDGFRFADPGLVDTLTEPLADHERADLRAATAERLVELGAEPARIASLFLAAEQADAAAPHALMAARRAAASQLHSEVLRWTSVARGRLPDDEGEILSLRADALTATGDASAVAVYRHALASAKPSAVPGLRARLARAALLAGDLSSAEDALAGLETDGGPDDGSILMATGMYAYFAGDLDGAESAVERARSIALAPGAPSQMLEVITLQGLIAHNRGEWFDRLRREMAATDENPQLVSTVFDSQLCVAEYLLYGPTPYAEVVEFARRLRDEAERAGARRAVAFATTVAGEAALLAGDLDTARRELTEAVELHAQTGGDTGVAHSLQRLAEVDLASGDRAAAERKLRRAMPLARWSPLARHLLQRIYGTLIGAAPDSASAMDVVEEALEAMDEPSACPFCAVMIAVPAAIACAEAGDLTTAATFMEQAEGSAMLWQGTAWSAAIEEARSVIARASGDPDEAERRMSRAAAMFDQAGQPLDAARCREALGV